MSIKEELYLQQAIAKEEERLTHVSNFLSKLPLDTEENTIVSLELCILITEMKEDLEKLKELESKTEKEDRITKNSMEMQEVRGTTIFK